jgi:proton-coupled amino acid transporter
VLPLQKEMKDPHAFPGMFGVLNTGMVLVGCLYLAMGFFGYLKYGEAVMSFGSITLNLPATPLNETVKLMFALSIFLTFGLQFYVPINILWPGMQSHFKLPAEANRTYCLELLFRATLVAFTCKSISSLVPSTSRP